MWIKVSPQTLYLILKTEALVVVCGFWFVAQTLVWPFQRL